MEDTKKAEISIRLSEFEMPPMQDVLIVGKNAPIGPEAAKRMVDVLSPDQYKIIHIGNHPTIEAIVIRKVLLNMMPEEKLSEIILEEGERIVDASMIIKAQLTITLHISKTIDL
jgi:hypothetical protein